MNEFGEPNMGNPSVRFDEGRERVGHWPRAFQSTRSCLLYITDMSYTSRTGWHVYSQGERLFLDPGGASLFRTSVFSAASC